MRALLIAALLLLLLLAGPAHATTWWVDGANGSNSNAGTSQGAAFATIYHVNVVAQPGDFVYILPTATYTAQGISVSGTPGNPITYVGYGGQPTITATNSSFGLYVTGAYLNIFNMHFTGPANGPMSCVDVVSPSAGALATHINISWNTVDTCGGDGINIFQGDYLTVSHNLIFGTSTYTLNGIYNSGISILDSQNSDASTAAKIVIDSNVIYGVTNTPNCAAGNTSCLSTASDSDGSCIILDSNYTQITYSGGISPGVAQPPYAGRFRVTNNVLAGCGGRGIHIYKTRHADVWNNTCYENNQDPYEGAGHPGEISIVQGGDASVVNNALYSTGGTNTSGGANTGALTGVRLDTSVAPLIVQNNVVYLATGSSVITYETGTTGGTSSISGNINANPQFKAAAQAQPFDFRPVSGSPLLAGANNSLGGVQFDIMQRLRGLPASVGAFEAASP